MNKETRTFIWGLILVIICGGGVAICISKMMGGTFKMSLDAILLFFSLYGLISGGIKLHRTVD